MSNFNDIQLFQQIFVLYRTICTTIEQQEYDPGAYKVLRGLYNQYDCMKSSLVGKIKQAICNNWSQYDHLLNNSSVTIMDIFSIITDRLKNNPIAMVNINKLRHLENIKISDETYNLVRQIVRNIGILSGAIEQE